ncbi:Lethal(3)malignant brain tumor-like protein 2, partial [Orchesella cincta]
HHVGPEQRSGRLLQSNQPQPGTSTGTENQVVKYPTKGLAPFGGEKWAEFAKPGMIVDAPNLKKRGTYWPALVHGFCGYKVLVSYVSVNQNVTNTAWFHFCSPVLKPFGYCLANKICLYPVSDADQKDDQIFYKLFAKCKEYLAIDTVKLNHWELCLAELNSTATRFQVGEYVEATCKLNCSVTRAGIINWTVGNRLNILYFGLEDDDCGFSYCQQSEDVHKAGWGRAVGVKVFGAKPIFRYLTPLPSDFPAVPAGVNIVEGAMFEMRHPIFLHKIVAAYVVKVLRHGYFIAGTDLSYPREAQEMVVHITNEYILPVNFCRDHGIDLQFPRRNGTAISNFSWRLYLNEMKRTALDLSCVKKEGTKFTRGCKMEAADLKSSDHFGPATVTKVCGHLLLLHFDGFPRTDEESYQWTSAHCADIYPAGYCEYTNIKLKAKPDRPNPGDMFELRAPQPETAA